MKNRAKILLSTLIVSIGVILGAGYLQAATISQSYITKDGDLKVGMTAALSSESTTDSQLVERASTNDAARFVGIVTTLEANLLTIDHEGANLYVATQGQTTAFATNLNGDVKKGDFLALSPLEGFVMKSDAEQAKVLGTALEDFPADKAQKQEVKNINGSTRTVDIAPMQISLNPQNLSGLNTEKQPFLVLFGQSLTGRAVSQWQVLSALIIFFILLVVEGSVIYGAVHGSVIALGRNPLAKKTIYKQFFKVIWVVMVVLAFGAAAIYAVLWA